jgi:hypothetical protein
MDYTPPLGGVLRVPCPRADCAQPAGVMCVYTSPYGKDGSGRYTAGQPMRIPHWERKAAARGRAERRAYYAMLHDRRPVTPASAAQHEITAAIREFDRREYAQLRDWLREHGAILWAGRRPDGTPRGETYLFGRQETSDGTR